MGDGRHRSPAPGRGDPALEFFPYPELDPKTSWFRCRRRLDDFAAFYYVCKATGPSETCMGRPRLDPPKVEGCGGRIRALAGPDGTLVRLIRN